MKITATIMIIILMTVLKSKLSEETVKFHKDQAAESPLCKICGAENERVSYIVREYKNINEEYKKNVKKGIAVYIVIFNVELSEKYRLEGAPQWYKHDTEGVTETEEYKILCDFVIQCDIKIEA